MVNDSKEFQTDLFPKINAYPDKKKRSNVFEIFTDGASRGNPGLSGIGFTFFFNSKEIYSAGYFIGNFLTNNVAEYVAMFSALKVLQKDFLSKFEIDEIHIFADSQLVIKQLNKIYKIKDSRLMLIFKKINLVLEKIEKEKKLSYIPRERNQLADKMANLGIDKKICLPDWLAAEMPLDGDFKI